MPSESLTWQLCPVVRASFHAVLHSGIDAVSLAAAMQEFSQTVEGLRQAHRLLTASLFRYQTHLFLYRADIIIAGLSPIMFLIEYLQTPEIIFSESGVREGVLYSMLKRE